MAYKRILTIQDISCVGQCSMTVALPILSACGHECCILPTAVLSTHTGGFGKPAVIPLGEQLDSVLQHWKENDLSFDAILVGYLGNIPAVEQAEKILDGFLASGGLAIVDPAMADHGRLYSGLTMAYARKMEALCRKADIILPNLTELSMFTGMEYKTSASRLEMEAMLEKLNHPCVVLTGAGFREGETGALVQHGKHICHCPHRKQDGSYHGTGDMFAAAFTGALMSGKDRMEAAQIAGEFVAKAIGYTVENPAHWYGVKFEKALPDLIRMVNNR